MQKIFFACIALLVVCSWADRPDDKYTHDDFMRQYKKKYTGSEKTTRQQIFNRNYAEIVRQNAKGANLVVNKFIDWTDA
jgi:hypothetical protein